MATIQFTSSASQSTIVLPETGIVTFVLVDGRPWAYAQTGAFDRTIDVAPALQAGQSVAVTYVPVVVSEGTAYVDGNTLLQALALKQNALTAGQGVTLSGNVISVTGFDQKADAATVNLLLSQKADANAMQSAMNTKADIAYVNNELQLLHDLINALSLSGGGGGGSTPPSPGQTYAAGDYFAEDYVA
jgi:hypothetical protein